MDHEDKRHYERIKLPYVIKFRSAEQDLLPQWDAVSPIDMSEVSICFFTIEEFKEGSKVQLLVTNPILKEERVYDCRVLRCEKSMNRWMFYKTVVAIENMPDDARETYLKVLHAFLEEINKNKKGRRRRSE